MKWVRRIKITHNKQGIEKNWCSSHYFFAESTNFLVESIIFLVLSAIILEESVTAVVTLSVFTVVVESVVVVLELDPLQAARRPRAKIVIGFFILMSFNLIPFLEKGNPSGGKYKRRICKWLVHR